VPLPLLVLLMGLAACGGQIAPASRLLSMGRSLTDQGLNLPALGS
jgi:hypothetical protein